MTQESVVSRVHNLQKMTVAELREEWKRVFGGQTKQRHRVFLWRRLARKLQEDQLPKLSAEEEAKIAEYRELIKLLPPERYFPGKQRGKVESKKSVTERRTPLPGSVISRQYHGLEIAVKVLDDGFEYDGRVYRSLSAIAKMVTGTTWNGPLFFGLRKGGRS